MAVTMKDVLAYIDSDEPNYAQAARLGPEALVHLRQLVSGKHLGRAAKAASLAGHIGAPEAVDVLATAARHEAAVVRVAAASAMRHLPDESRARPLVGMLRDDDAGVRRVAMQSVPERIAPELAHELERLARTERVSAIRTLAEEALRRRTE